MSTSLASDRRELLGRVRPLQLGGDMMANNNIHTERVFITSGETGGGPLAAVWGETQDYFTTKVGSLGKKERRSDVTQFGSDLVVFSCDSICAHVTGDFVWSSEPSQPKTPINDSTD